MSTAIDLSAGRTKKAAISGLREAADGAPSTSASQAEPASRGTAAAGTRRMDPVTTKFYRPPPLPAGPGLTLPERLARFNPIDEGRNG